MGSLERKLLDKPGVKRFEDGVFCLSCDLGQSGDPTAIAVIEHITKFDVTYRGVETARGEEFHVRHLERLPLGLSYLDQVEHVAQLLRRPPLSAGCDLIIDASGVGRAVADLFDRVGLKPLKVTITGGERASATGERAYNVPKGVVISGLDARLHANELKFAAELTEASTMAEELKHFRRNVSAAGRFTWEARSGKHDDLVLAVGIGVWNFIGRIKHRPTQVSKYGYTRKRS